MKQVWIVAKCVETGKDLSSLISTLRFEDSTKEASQVEFGIYEDYALESLDGADFAKGNTIEFQFGWLGGVVSEVHTAKVKDIEATYTSTVTAKVKCTDSGHSMRRGGTPVIWSGKKASDIAKEIATKHGLTAVVDDTETVYSNNPQGNKSDYDFLRELATKEKKGDFQFYVRGDTLHFVKKGLDKDSEFVITVGDDDFISFEPQTKDTTKSTTADGIKLVGVDSFNKEVKVDKVGMPEAEDEESPALDQIQQDAQKQLAGLGSIDVSKVLGTGDGMPSIPEIPKDEPAAATYDANSTKQAAVGANAGFASVFEKTPYLAPDDYKYILAPLDSASGNGAPNANNVIGSGNENNTTGTLKLEGNPNRVPGVIVTIKGVAQRHVGNWYMEKVEHVIDFANTAYANSCSLVRKKGVGKVNATEGTTPTGDTEPNKAAIATGIYDENGNFVIQKENVNGGFAPVVNPVLYK